MSVRDGRSCQLARLKMVARRCLPARRGAEGKSGDAMTTNTPVQLDLFILEDRIEPKRDAGLRRAIAAAGGIGALARLLGMSAQALSEWRRVRTHRLLQVEAVTGIELEFLRP